MIFEEKILLGMKFRQIKNTNYKLLTGWTTEDGRNLDLLVSLHLGGLDQNASDNWMKDNN